jgi:hypothetical protein
MRKCKNKVKIKISQQTVGKNNKNNKVQAKSRERLQRVIKMQNK